MTTAPATQAKRQRTCIACGAKGGKSSLFRIVRSTQGAVSFDPSGKMAGRGAYVCSPACLEALRGSKKLAAALRTAVDKNDFDQIAQQISSCMPTDDAAIQ